MKANGNFLNRRIDKNTNNIRLRNLMRLGKNY